MHDVVTAKLDEAGLVIEFPQQKAKNRGITGTEHTHNAQQFAH